VVVAISDLEFGGAQRQVVELVNNMDPAICRMRVCSLSPFVPLAKAIRLPGEHLSLVPRRFRFDFTVVPRLARLLRTLRADVVHCFLFDATIAGRLAGRLAGRPAVIDSERNTNYPVKRSDFLALRATQRWNDLTIANSRAGADFNSRLFGRPPDRYRVIHNGVDVDRFTPRDGAETRHALGLAEGQPVVGMFASFKPQKNHLHWLRAARQVVERAPQVKFLFVGDELYKGGSDSTEFKRTIRQTVASLGLEPYCLFPGNRTDVEKYYSACTATVLPSLFEGTPNVALESMACGVPIVASDVSDNAYIVPDGRAGFVVPLNDEAALADRVCRLLLDQPLQHKMSREARSWVAGEFSCRRLAEKTAAVYQEAARLRPAVS
jgi:glycosyltransferase involved in cell wall biosynthesis